MICDRCGREAVGWVLRRGDKCSPKGWVKCIREPEDVARTTALKFHRCDFEECPGRKRTARVREMDSPRYQRLHSSCVPAARAAAHARREPLAFVTSTHHIPGGDE